MRQFRAQFDKAGLIIDERFNSVARSQTGSSKCWAASCLTTGPCATERTGFGRPPPLRSQGHADQQLERLRRRLLPVLFPESRPGAAHGTRTWGGLIGITGSPLLVDGGGVTVPSFGIYSTKGEWIIEDHGVDPDIPVVDDPSLMARGRDPQLERAIEEVLKALKKNPPAEVKKPKYPIRAGR